MHLAYMFFSISPCGLLPLQSTGKKTLRLFGIPNHSARTMPVILSTPLESQLHYTPCLSRATSTFGTTNFRGISTDSILTTEGIPPSLGSSCTGSSGVSTTQITILVAWQDVSVTIRQLPTLQGARLITISTLPSMNHTTHMTPFLGLIKEGGSRRAQLQVESQQPTPLAILMVSTETKLLPRPTR